MGVLMKMYSVAGGIRGFKVKGEGISENAFTLDVKSGEAERFSRMPKGMGIRINALMPIPSVVRPSITGHWFLFHTCASSSSNSYLSNSFLQPYKFPPRFSPSHSEYFHILCICRDGRRSSFSVLPGYNAFRFLRSLRLT